MFRAQKIGSGYQLSRKLKAGDQSWNSLEFSGLLIKDICFLKDIVMMSVQKFGVWKEDLFCTL